MSVVVYTKLDAITLSDSQNSQLLIQGRIAQARGEGETACALPQMSEARAEPQGKKPRTYLVRGFLLK